MNAYSKRNPLPLLALLFAVATMAVVYIINRPTEPTYSAPSGMTVDEQIDAEAATVQNLLTEYQVDVHVTSAHSAKHVTSADALRCLNNKGNVAAFSEYDTRNLHLLCWDENSQTLFDVIIRRINFWVEKFSNPTSELLTAYAPEGVQGVSMAEKMNFYLQHLLKTIGGKVVQLRFGPGEVMFIPK